MAEGKVIERVVGPIDGYYIASYACAMGDLGRQFLGFAKLCATRPPDFWKADPCAEFNTGRLLDSPETALEHAENQARSRIASLRGT